MKTRFTSQVDQSRRHESTIRLLRVELEKMQRLGSERSSPPSSRLSAHDADAVEPCITSSRWGRGQRGRRMPASTSPCRRAASEVLAKVRAYESLKYSPKDHMRKKIAQRRKRMENKEGDVSGNSVPSTGPSTPAQSADKIGEGLQGNSTRMQDAEESTAETEIREGHPRSMTESTSETDLSDSFRLLQVAETNGLERFQRQNSCRSSSLGSAFSLSTPTSGSRRSSSSPSRRDCQRILCVSGQVPPKASISGLAVAVPPLQLSAVTDRQL